MNLFNFHHHTLGNFYGIYNLELGENVPESYFSVGIHPKDIDENWEKHFEAFKKISLQDNCLAIGECGLDSLIDIDANLQKTVFERQILWANEIQKPVIIHCVKWFQELIPFQKLAEVPLIIHGFNKKKSVADEMLKHGFFLSFGKSVLYNLSLQSILKEIPIDKIFLETDDTDFDIAELYQKVSEIKEISLEELQKKISENLQSINVKF
jgi:TatD DNase family protein